MLLKTLKKIRQEWGKNSWGFKSPLKEATEEARRSCGASNLPQACCPPHGDPALCASWASRDRLGVGDAEQWWVRLTVCVTSWGPSLVPKVGLVCLEPPYSLGRTQSAGRLARLWVTSVACSLWASPTLILPSLFVWRHHQHLLTSQLLVCLRYSWYLTS